MVVQLNVISVESCDLSTWVVSISWNGALLVLSLHPTILPLHDGLVNTLFSQSADAPDNLHL